MIVVLKYYFVASITVILNYVLFNTLYCLDYGTVISNTITYLTIFIIAFILQKRFTFKVRGNHRQQLILFFLCAVGYYTFDTLILIGLINGLTISPFISKVVSIAILSPINFLVQKKYVFIEKDLFK